MEREYVVAVDTREQLPYSWEGVECQVKTLSAGDYSIIGMEQVVCVERKSFADFYGCLTAGRERFENDLHRMASCRYPVVVVEADLTRLLMPFTYAQAGGIATSLVPPLVAQNSLLSWQARYRIPFILCGERSGGSRMTIQHLDTIWRLEKEDARKTR